MQDGLVLCLDINNRKTWSSFDEASAGLSSVRVLSAVDDVTVGVTSVAVTDGVRTSFVDRTTADPATFDPPTCDPVLPAVAPDCLELALVDNSALSLSILTASFFTVCQQTIHSQHSIKHQ